MLCPFVLHFTQLTSLDSCVNKYLAIGSERFYQTASVRHLTGYPTGGTYALQEVQKKARMEWPAKWGERSEKKNVT